MTTLPTVTLPNWTQGARRPSMLVTWYREDTTTPEDLTGATLSGFIRADSLTGTAAAITGDLTVTDGENGVFRWDFSAADVASAGRLEVQFNATFDDGQTPAKTFVAAWYVQRSLGA